MRVWHRQRKKMQHSTNGYVQRMCDVYVARTGGCNIGFATTPTAVAHERECPVWAVFIMFRFTVKHFRFSSQDVHFIYLFFDAKERRSHNFTHTVIYITVYHRIKIAVPQPIIFHYCIT